VRLERIISSLELIGRSCTRARDDNRLANGTVTRTWQPRRAASAWPAIGAVYRNNRARRFAAITSMWLRRARCKTTPRAACFHACLHYEEILIASGKERKFERKTEREKCGIADEWHAALPLYFRSECVWLTCFRNRDSVIGRFCGEFSMTNRLIGEMLCLSDATAIQVYLIFHWTISLTVLKFRLPFFESRPILSTDLSLSLSLSLSTYPSFRYSCLMGKQNAMKGKYAQPSPR